MLSHLSQKFKRAAEWLATEDQPLRKRIATAYGLQLENIEAEALPPDLREHFQALQALLTRVPASTTR
jgi:hypothetical protein